MSLRDEFERQVENPCLSEQQRGIQLEKFIGKICMNEGHLYRKPYRPKGEQVDGAVQVLGKTYLLEIKYQNRPIPASKVYEFRGKIEGKLSGTLGIFWSMSGYSEDCLQAVRIGKDLNVILFDRSDLDAILDEEIKFNELLQEKVWIATTSGVVYYPSSQRGDLRETDGPKFIFLVEGETDSLIVFDLLKSQFPNLNPDNYNIVINHGKANVLNAINITATNIPFFDTRGVIAVIDKDDLSTNQSRALRKNLYDELESMNIKDRFHIAIADPSIEGWLHMSKPYDIQELKKHLGKLDWNTLITCEPEISSIVSFIRDKLEER